jgi:hypothetical protein
MKIITLLSNFSDLSQKRISRVCWSAIGTGIITTMSIYLLFDWAQSGVGSLVPTDDVGSLLPHRLALMLVANAASFLGAGTSAAVATMHAPSDCSSARPAYIVWLITTLILMVQIGMTTHPPPANRMNSLEAAAVKTSASINLR